MADMKRALEKKLAERAYDICASYLQDTNLPRAVQDALKAQCMVGFKGLSAQELAALQAQCQVGGPEEVKQCLGARIMASLGLAEDAIPTLKAQICKNLSKYASGESTAAEFEQWCQADLEGVERVGQNRMPYRNVFQAPVPEGYYPLMGDDTGGDSAEQSCLERKYEKFLLYHFIPALLYRDGALSREQIRAALGESISSYRIDKTIDLLRSYHLIEQISEEGVYRITAKGRRFVEARPRCLRLKAPRPFRSPDEWGEFARRLRENEEFISYFLEASTVMPDESLEDVDGFLKNLDKKLVGSSVGFHTPESSRRGGQCSGISSDHKMRTYATGLCVPYKVKIILQKRIVSWIQARKARWIQNVVPNLKCPSSYWRRSSNNWVEKLPEKLRYPAWLFYNRVCGVYERVFVEGVRNYCRNVSAILNCEMTSSIFSQYYSDPKKDCQWTSLRKKLPPDEGRPWQDSARWLYHTMALTAQDRMSKLDRFKIVLFKMRDGGVGLAGVASGYLLTGFLPFHVKLYLANTPEYRGLSPSWVRNLTFGWRRKLDPLLPPPFQRGLLPRQRHRMQELLWKTVEAVLMKVENKGYRKYRVKYRQVLKRLGRRHLLHMLVSPIKFPRGVIYEGQGAYFTRARELHKMLSNSLVYEKIFKDTYIHRMQFSKSEFIAAAEESLSQKEKIIKEYQVCKEEFQRGSLDWERYSNYQNSVKTHWFVCKFIADFVRELKNYEDRLKRGDIKKDGFLDRVNNVFAVLMGSVLPSTQQLRGYAAILSSMRIKDRDSRVLQFETVFRNRIRAQLLNAGVYMRESDLPPIGRRKFFAGLATIISNACFRKYGGMLIKTNAEGGFSDPQEIRGRIAALMTSDRMITPPFCSKNRKIEKEQPLELVQGYEQAPLYRLAPFKVLTQLLRMNPHLLIFKLPMKQVKSIWGMKGESGWLRTLLKAKFQKEMSPFRDDLFEFLDEVFGRRMIELFLSALCAPDAIEVAMRHAIQNKGELEHSINKFKRFRKEGYMRPVGLPMEARLTKRMRKVVMQSTESMIRTARILPPAPASRKVVIEIVFSIPSGLPPTVDVLAPSTNFLCAERAYGTELSPPKETPITNIINPPQLSGIPSCLGLDVNRLSEHVVAAAIVQRNPTRVLIQSHLDVRDRLIPILILSQKLRWVDYLALLQEIQRVPEVPVEIGLREYLTGVRDFERMLTKLVSYRGSRAGLECILDIRTLWARIGDPNMVVTVSWNSLSKIFNERELDKFLQIPSPKQVVKRIKDYLYNRIRRVSDSEKVQFATSLKKIKQLEKSHERGLLPEISRTNRALDFFKNQQAFLERLQNEETQLTSGEFTVWRERILRRLFRIPRAEIYPPSNRAKELKYLAEKIECKIGRIKEELTLLYRRKEHLKTAIDCAFELVSSQVAVESGVPCIAMEDLEVTTRSSGGVFAEMITYMPKKRDLRYAIGARVSQVWSVLTKRSIWIPVIDIDPRGTSRYCAVLINGVPCGMKLRPVKESYDLQQCPIHGIQRRHINSALEIARRGLVRWENRGKE
jgi:hypothetical protein